MGRRAIVLLVALILAGLAAWAVWNFMQNVREDAIAGQEQVTVFRAGPGGIAEGTEGNILISDFDNNGTLIVEGIDQIEDTPPDAIQSEDELRSILGGQISAGPISEHAILTRAQWTEVTVDVQPLAEQIASGNQAITISTSDIQGVNGFVEAGDRINMIITLDIEFDLIPIAGAPVLPSPDDDTAAEPDEETVVVTYTRYVLQGLNVLAAGRDVRVEDDGDLTGQIDAGPGTGTEGVAGAEGQPQEPSGNSTVFTLEVTPDQAERIVYAFENGSIWLTLVPEDFVEIETDGVTIDNLFGGDLEEAIFGE
ncbi:MAG TPA: RcpC/CpaB family pilus assembly protein [Acidimicrobiia bacterium]|nr:RcpC/CpaB family pilus assembly protein [Acidimicrobiia bacterium]